MTRPPETVAGHLAAAAQHLHAARGHRPDDVAAAMTAIQQVARLAQAITLDLAAAAHESDTARQQGAASTQAWIAHTAGISHRDAARDVQLARDLATTAPQTRAAMDRPGMSPDKARVVTSAMGKLPRELDDGDRTVVEADLVAKAQKHSIEDLRLAAKRSVEAMGRDWADRQEAVILDAEEKRAHRQSEFWMRPADADAMVEGGFVLPVLEADSLRSALESHTSPRHDCMNQPAESTDLLDEKPTYRHKLGHAFGDIVRHLPADCYGNHGGVAATLVVTTDFETLKRDVERAGTDSHGTRIDPGTIRRLVCDAGVLPVVLGGDGKVLDVGRQKRLFTTTQRVALAQRDGGCAFPGCDRPPGWTEAHHMRPWAAGGSTDLADGVLLCARHHRIIHHTGWDVRPGPDDRPEFIPPASIDPTCTPRHNDRWRPKQAGDPVVRQAVA
ncbi:DUF222 domain-containing protein [Aeromicrobium sp.]|uniref:HNH endonuclease signature motif containing protein n=1 Tax=Aeromicrobium sp. TaxID=1871063 RepID=UPI003D6B4097